MLINSAYQYKMYAGHVLLLMQVASPCRERKKCSDAQIRMM